MWCAVTHRQGHEGEAGWGEGKGRGGVMAWEGAYSRARRFPGGLAQQHAKPPPQIRRQARDSEQRRANRTTIHEAVFLLFISSAIV